MIEIYLLEQLAAVKEYGTLSDAAKHLRIAQPSVSRAMKKIESGLGAELFKRSKNKITLNETGKLAAQYAQDILDLEEKMQKHIKEFDESLNSVSIGSVAPGPLMVLLPRLAVTVADTTVSSNISDEDELITGLKNSKYNLLILNRPVKDEKYVCAKYLSERLFANVSHFHPAAAQKKISFSEMDGQNFIMYSRVGLWEEIVKSKMPDAKFFKQENMDAVAELSSLSDLPTFSTDITQEVISSRSNMGRVNIPFSDKEAEMQFYLIYNISDKKRFEKIISSV